MDNVPAPGVLKCHKCRRVLVEDITIIRNNNTTCNPQQCSSYNINSFIYLAEDSLPNWIKSKVEETWTKGKLVCEQCGCKVGAFDFVSGRKCICKDTVLPPVHLVASQVDRPINPIISYSEIDNKL